MSSQDKRTDGGSRCLDAGAKRDGWVRLGFGAVVATVVILALATVARDYQLQQWSVWAAFAVLAMSFVWVWGHGGIFSFAQVAFFGVGAYIYGAAGINLFPRTNETVSAVFIAIAAAAALAVVVGYFLFYGNVSGVYVAIVTLAVSLILNTLMSSLSHPKYKIGEAALGGFNGMVGIPPLTLPGTDFLGVRQLFLVMAGCAVLSGLTITALRHSAFGRVVRAVEQNPDRAQLLGYDVRRIRLAVFVFGGAFAGLAGALYSAWGGFVDPSVFGLQMATMLAIWVLVGGRSSVTGAAVGVILIGQMSTSIAQAGSDIGPMFLGAILIAVVLVIPQGLVPSLLRITRSIRDRLSTADSSSADAPTDPGPFPIFPAPSGGKSIEARGVTKRYGGIAAVKEVDLSISSPGVHVLLGPNGAGKSTLFHLLMGTANPTSGRVLLGGRDISHSRPDVRARAGIAMKLQVTRLFGELTVRENLWLAAYASSRSRRTADVIADELSRWLGYAGGAMPEANEIAHGKQQWLDIAMAMATQPSVLLLDEPAAGMGRAETSRIAELIRTVGESISVVVVEHDMQFVEELEAPVSVLHQGQLLMQGTLDEARANDEVLEVYLGRDTNVAD